MASPSEMSLMCRLCLMKDKKQVNIPIFEDRSENKLLVKIRALLPIKISEEDQLPKKICDGCSEKLNLLYEFRNTAIDSEQTLLSWLLDDNLTINVLAEQIAKPAETIVKEEVEVEEESPYLDLTQYSSINKFQEAKEEEAEEPAAKRPRRFAAVKSQISIAPESNDDNDEDKLDTVDVEAIEYLEYESDGNDNDEDIAKLENESDTDLSSSVPENSAYDQPGPSGLGKSGAETPMNPLNTKKTIKRGLWTEEQLKEALRAVQNGMSVRRAAVVYAIPRRTLRNHIKSGIEEKKIGRNSLLTREQENYLIARIFRLATIGYPLTGKLIRRSVFRFCEENNIKHTFSKEKGLAGKKWLKLFRQRHPNLAKRKAQHLNQARAAKLNKFIVKDHFDKLKDIMVSMDIVQNAHLLYNMDEKGCQLCLHKQPMVFAEKGSKNVHIIADEHAENVTIVSCGNAIGQVVPPMILFKGKRQKEEWKENLPLGSKVMMTEKDGITTEVFVQWIQHFAKFKPNEKVLLIFDGASSHLDYSIVQEAERHNIVLYCLPSNTTHYLQPMDRSVFGPFETYWDNEVMLFWTNKPHHKITKTNFGLIFSKAWAKATTQSNVSAGFRATGIYPFNPDVIPDHAFAPSEVSFRRAPETKENDLRENAVEACVDDKARPGTSGLNIKKEELRNKTNEILVQINDYEARPGTSGVNIKKRKQPVSSDSSSTSENFSLHDSGSSMGELEIPEEFQTPEKENEPTTHE